MLKPRFIVLDEPTSALDMTVQAQIVDLLRDLQSRHKLAYLFISHDLKVVRALADEVVVLRDGKVVERGPAEQVFDAPQTPYTQALIAAAFNLEAIGADKKRRRDLKRKTRGGINGGRHCARSAATPTACSGKRC